MAFFITVLMSGLCIAPFFANTWRIYFITAALGLMPIVIGWCALFVLFSKSGAGDLLGLAILLLIIALLTAIYAGILIGRAIGLRLQRARGWPRWKAIFIDIVPVFTLFIAVAALLVLNIDLKTDEPSEACLNNFVRAEISQTVFTLPTPTYFQLRMQERETPDANLRTKTYRFIRPQQRKDFCDISSDNTKIVNAIALEFSPTPYQLTKCDPALVYPGSEELCVKSQTEVKMIVPKQIEVFGEMAPKTLYRHYQRATYEALETAHTGAPWRADASILEADGAVERFADGYLVAKNRVTPLGQPLVAFCEVPDLNRDANCYVRYNYSEALTVAYRYSAPLEEASDRLLSHDTYIDVFMQHLAEAP